MTFGCDFFILSLEFIILEKTSTDCPGIISCPLVNVHFFVQSQIPPIIDMAVRSFLYNFPNSSTTVSVIFGSFGGREGKSQILEFPTIIALDVMMKEE